MKAHTSIAFNTLSGTAGEVTARETKNGTVLSSRAQHSLYSRPEGGTRNPFTCWPPLQNSSAEQNVAWNNFSRQFSGNSDSYRLTGCNVYVRHNCNRALMGLEPIDNPPAEIVSVPAVTFDTLTVTPQLIEFQGITDPGTSFRLAITMSKATSAGVSYGRGKCVIISPDFTPDEGKTNLTRIYASRLGLIPEVGQKYFITVWWIERNTGSTGQRSYLDRICTLPVPTSRARYKDKCKFRGKTIFQLA